MNLIAILAQLGMNLNGQAQIKYSVTPESVNVEIIDSKAQWKARLLWEKTKNV